MSTCDKIRGSLACEECDNWVTVEVIKTTKHPMGYAVQQCKLDKVSGGSKEKETEQ